MSEIVNVKAAKALLVVTPKNAQCIIRKCEIPLYIFAFKLVVQKFGDKIDSRIAKIFLTKYQRVYLTECFVDCVLQISKWVASGARTS